MGNSGGVKQGDETTGGRVANPGRGRPSVPPVVRSDGTVQISRVGVQRHWVRDVYHFFRTSSWPLLMTMLAAGFVASNLGFACLYFLGGDCIANGKPGSFLDAFFFSVQTMSTIGYGRLAPVGVYANGIVCLEALYGLLFTATATGVIFSKFGTPVARVRYSGKALISQDVGERKLMFRMANDRPSHMIVEAQIRVVMVCDEVEPDGEMRRRLIDLKLQRKSSPLFSLTWTVFHVIDESSPLHGLDRKALEDLNVIFIVTMTGIDDTLAQTVHSRHAYGVHDLEFDMKFEDVLVSAEDGTRQVNYNNFDRLRPVS